MASIKKRGSSWAVRVSYYDAFGKRHFKNDSFRTKKEAQYFASINETGKQLRDNIIDSNEPFADYFSDWYQTYKAPSVAAATQKNYQFTLDKVTAYFRQAKISDISRTLYQDFLNDLATKYSHETVAKIAGHCRACAFDAIEDGVIRRNFTTRTTIPHCTDYDTAEIGENYLNFDDMTKLKKFILPKASINNVSAIMVLTSLLSGARYSEVAGLTWSDIDYTNSSLRINKTLDYKGDGGFLPTKTKSSNRVITVPDYLIKILGNLRQDQVAAGVENSRHLIFIGKHSSQVPTNNAVNNLLRRAHDQLKIKQITFHGLRHTHASYLLYKDVSIYMISKRLGHSDIGITQRVYAHVITELRDRQSKMINSALESF